jgi:xanthine dehydrogenase accessory factor
MRDLLEAVARADAEGSGTVLATVVATIRSAPRQPGAKMLVRGDGSFLGSVSGGCVEADVVERARAILAGAPAELVHYGVADRDAWEVGLSCGGEIDVWIERADASLWREVEALLDDGSYGMLVTDTRSGAKRLEPGVLGATGLDEDKVFAELIEGPLRLFIFGAVEAAEHLCAYARQLGWRTTVVDTRAALATPARLPSADEILAVWPESVEELIDARSAVVTLSHEERFDVPALAAALRRGARYIGAIGARRTQERRREALSAQGFGAAELERIHGPVGLDLGGRAPAEVALAIAAELVAVLNTPAPELART